MVLLEEVGVVEEVSEQEAKARMETNATNETKCFFMLLVGPLNVHLSFLVQVRHYPTKAEEAGKGHSKPL